jgi:Protein kinase domain/PH domain
MSSRLEVSLKRKRSNFVGSPYWMPPEVIEGRESFSLLSDVWSLGCTVLELFAGAPPFADLAPNLAMFRIAEATRPPLPSGCSPAMTSFLECCLERRLNRRKTVEELKRHRWIASSRALSRTSSIMHVQRRQQQQQQRLQSLSATSLATSLSSSSSFPPPPPSSSSSLLHSSSSSPTSTAPLAADVAEAVYRSTLSPRGTATADGGDDDGGADVSPASGQVHRRRRSLGSASATKLDRKKVPSLSLATAMASETIVDRRSLSTRLRDANVVIGGADKQQYSAAEFLSLLKIARDLSHQLDDMRFRQANAYSGLFRVSQAIVERQRSVLTARSLLPSSHGDDSHHHHHEHATPSKESIESRRRSLQAARSRLERRAIGSADEPSTSLRRAGSLQLFSSTGGVNADALGGGDSSSGDGASSAADKSSGKMPSSSSAPISLTSSSQSSQSQSSSSTSTSSMPASASALSQSQSSLSTPSSASSPPPSLLQAGGSSSSSSPSSSSSSSSSSLTSSVSSSSSSSSGLAEDGSGSSSGSGSDSQPAVTTGAATLALARAIYGASSASGDSAGGSGSGGIGGSASLGSGGSGGISGGGSGGAHLSPSSLITYEQICGRATLEASFVTKIQCTRSRTTASRWKKRHWVLCDDFLFVFAKPKKSHAALAALHLPLCQLNTLDNGRECCLVVIADRDETWYLRSRSMDDVNMWFQTAKHAKPWWLLS